MYVQIVAFATWFGQILAKAVSYSLYPIHNYDIYYSTTLQSTTLCKTVSHLYFCVFKCTQHKPICSSAKLSHRQIHSQNRGQLPFLTIPKSH